MRHTLTIPGYRCTFTVTGFERRRNAGPVLTLAVGTWTRDGFTREHRISDIVTRMRLADMLSHHHEFPVNAEKLYGPRGRMADVGRA